MRSYDGTTFHATVIIFKLVSCRNSNTSGFAFMHSDTEAKMI